MVGSGSHFSFDNLSYHDEDLLFSVDIIFNKMIYNKIYIKFDVAIN